MKTLTIASLCCSCLLGVAALAGAQDHADKKDMMKDVKVTGCVAAGTEADHFMLNNAMMADKKDGAPMAYALMGGTLKPHVGHQVEVTGTWDEKKSTMAADKAAMAPHGLKVKSVKMISPTCQ